MNESYIGIEFHLVIALILTVAFAYLIKKNSNVKNLFNKKNDFLCIPKKIMKNVKIDGYFASMIIKNDD